MQLKRYLPKELLENLVIESNYDADGMDFFNTHSIILKFRTYRNGRKTIKVNFFVDESCEVYCKLATKLIKNLAVARDNAEFIILLSKLFK